MEALGSLFDSQASETEIINFIEWIPCAAHIGAPKLGISCFDLVQLGL